MRNPKRPVLWWSAAVLIACPLPAFGAPNPGVGNPGVGNLGDSLLDDDLAKALSPAAAPEDRSRTQPPAKRGPAWLPEGDALGRLLQQGAQETAGEDVGESPLASVVAGMRRAEGLIRDDSDDRVAVPVQREVVTQLERLIAEMEKQCQGGNCNKSGEQKKKERQASKRSQPKEGQKPGESKEGESDKPGSKANAMAMKANTSGTTSLSGAPTADTPEARQELLKAAWGHLPERMRERMMQGSDSEFLPEYRDELQQYYRRLAERSSREAP